MKKILFSIFIFVAIPLSAFASDIVGHSFEDSSYNITYTQTGTQNGRAFYQNIGADRMVCYYPTNPYWVAEKISTYSGNCNFATGNEADAFVWENGQDVLTPDLVTVPHWLQVHNGFSASNGYFTAVIPPPPPPAGGIQGLIDNASTTLVSAFHFTFMDSDIVNFMVPLLHLTIGTGIGMLQLTWPYILGLIFIGAIIYFLYRGFRLWTTRY